MPKEISEYAKTILINSFWDKLKAIRGILTGRISIVTERIYLEEIYAKQTKNHK